MALIKNSPGAKITNSTVTGNTQIGGDTMIDNQGEIEDSNIEHNLHTYPGGTTWVDKYDERLNPKSRFAWFFASLIWLRDHVLASVIISILSVVLGIYIAKWLQPTPPQSPANIPTPMSSRPAS